jgi:hypothetical protein
MLTAAMHQAGLSAEDPRATPFILAIMWLPALTAMSRLFRGRMTSAAQRMQKPAPARMVTSPA